MKLNSWDEWSPLQEVILGSAANYRDHVDDLSFKLFFHDNLKQIPAYYPDLHGGTGLDHRLVVNPRYVDELHEDVEGMASVLRELGVVVHRPMPLAETTGTVTTPAWSSTVLPPLNVRDNTLILGDEIIETPPMLRARYFETQFLTGVFQKYFVDGARWTVMPRPIMTDASFDPSYAERDRGNTEYVPDPRRSPYDVGLEMMFDGAQCLRFGRDIIANIATRNHALACDWLARHVEGRIRIHRIYELTDSHIDSMLMPLRPGTLLVRSERVRDYLPRCLWSWDRIVAPPPDPASFPSYGEHDLVLASPFIDLNVLSVNPATVIVNEACPSLRRCLERHGFDTIPVRHRHRRLFGGGFHCFTLDTVRDGGAEDYLQ